MNDMGHNENAIRLASLAGDAQIALDKVARGESDAIDGWLAYGTALNEGRSLFAEDKAFGKWVSENLSDNLSVSPNDHERAAAMWAAANSDQFAEASNAGSARTVRGIHAKWKEVVAEREKAEKEADHKAEAERKRAEAKAAREKADAMAKEEAEARDAAAAAKTEQAREEAEEKAEKATAAKEAAQQAAQEAEEDALGAEVPEDPYADARKALAGMSREGLEDELIGLRDENKDLRSRVKSQRSDIADLQSRIKDLTDSDAGRTIGNLQRRLTQSEGRSKEHQANAARLQRQVNAQKAEADKLRKSLEMQEIAL